MPLFEFLNLPGMIQERVSSIDVFNLQRVLVGQGIHARGGNRGRRNAGNYRNSRLRATTATGLATELSIQTLLGRRLWSGGLEDVLVIRVRR